MAITLLHAGRVLTPTAQITDAGILIREGVIEELGLREGMRLPDGAQEIYATDKTAIPGFVDVHIHKSGNRSLIGCVNLLSAVGQPHSLPEPELLNHALTNQYACVGNLRRGSQDPAGVQ